MTLDEFRSLADLLDLQDVDLQIDRLLHDRESLPELVAYREAAAREADLSARHDTVASQLRETELLLDKTTGELELARLKLSQEQNRLYAGGLRARDADYLRREVEMLRTQESKMEDEILELMETKDERETGLVELSDELEKAQADRGSLEALITDEWRKIDARLAVKEERKATVASLISDELMTLYEELRGVKEGVAVGRLADGVCGGCHLTLTPAEQLEVTR
ncbi:MAG: zinc ribbon domain-containing protein, partial [Acidimicrobiia bacterium]